eukprot:8116717-Heterocapsa_arctica.AAC.1
MMKLWPGSKATKPVAEPVAAPAFAKHGFVVVVKETATQVCYGRVGEVQTDHCSVCNGEILARWRCEECAHGVPASMEQGSFLTLKGSGAHEQHDKGCE